MKRWSAFGLLLALLLPRVEAHPLAPALLELRELEGARYAVLWRTSIARVQGTNVQPLLPAECRPVTPMQQSAEENQSQVLRWQLYCAGQGVSGRTLAVSGLERSGISVILRIEPLQGAVITRLLDANEPSFVVPARQPSTGILAGYFKLGVEHLLFGLDHVLLVLGLVLLVRRLRALMLAITAFTLGHSMTLALATLGVVAVDQRVTELAIAGSILYLAVEILRPSQHATLMHRRPWLVAALFGLLHGLGFAGALAQIGLPAGEIPLALFAFNLGIEAGQLVLIGILLLSLSLSEANTRRVERAGVRVYGAGRALSRAIALAPVYLIGSMAAFWCLERAALIMRG